MSHLSIPRLTRKQLIRFWAKVCIKNQDECWEWVAGKNSSGYGRVSLNHQSFGAHRVSYFLRYQKDPGELCVCHTCDNPKCVNPSHLWLGSFKDDMQDMTKKGRGRIPHLKGSQCGASKLTDQQVLDIRAYHVQGTSQRALSRQYKVVPQTVNDIIHRKTWAHI